MKVLHHLFCRGVATATDYSKLKPLVIDSEDDGKWYLNDRSNNIASLDIGISITFMKILFRLVLYMHFQKKFSKIHKVTAKWCKGKFGSLKKKKKHLSSSNHVTR